MKILEHFNPQEAKSVSLPTNHSDNLNISQSTGTEQYQEMLKVPYHEALSLLMHAALPTRPECSFFPIPVYANFWK